jgi:hypothetical protein
MPEQSPTLRDMILEALDNGVTYRKLEAAAIDPETGQTASRAVFVDTVSGKLNRMPFDYHLRAVAAALKVPYERVRQAAIEQWVPAEGRRRDSDREQLRATVQQLQEQARQLLEQAADLDARIDSSSRSKSA